MGTTIERTYGPWHDVKMTFETLWDDHATRQDYVYYVGHPAECGWSEEGPDACPFEEVLDGHDHDGTGDFEARVFKDPYLADPDDDEYGLEWRLAGGDPR